MGMCMKALSCSDVFLRMSRRMKWCESSHAYACVCTGVFFFLCKRSGYIGVFSRICALLCVCACNECGRVHAHVYMRTSVFASTHVCRDIRECAGKCVLMRMRAYVFTYACTFICTCIHVCVRACMCARLCVYECVCVLAFVSAHLGTTSAYACMSVHALVLHTCVQRQRVDHGMSLCVYVRFACVYGSLCVYVCFCPGMWMRIFRAHVLRTRAPEAIDSMLEPLNMVNVICILGISVA